LLSAPVRRGALGLVLIAVVLFPGGAAALRSKTCPERDCPAHGALIWTRSLTGSWVAQSGAEGTVYGDGQAYAAIGSGIAAIGFGLSLDAYDEATGFPRWAATLGGVPFGSSIISVRVWPGVVTAGVSVGVSGASSSREEFVLNAVTGKQIAAYPATWLGGAVSANRKRTVIVGSNGVTCYDNSTHKVLWRDPTGAAGQAWQVDRSSLYVTVSAAGEAGTAPVTAVQQINLKTGVPWLIQPSGPSFVGRLSGVADGSLLFSGVAGLSIYSAATGRLTGFRAGAVPQVVDPVQHVLYADVNGALIGIDPVTGRNIRGRSYPGPPGTYGVRGGVALGLDPGANGAAWGYNVARKRVIWTSRVLPWPHFFVDLSGIGGSADPSSGMVLLAICSKVGRVVQSQSESESQAAAGGASQVCLRPTLVAIQR
jgi:outer membrane protein assembly factor BamB